MERTQGAQPWHGEQPPEVQAALAYVKIVEEEGERFYAVFHGDGRLAGVAPTRALAFAAARQYELSPADAH